MLRRHRNRIFGAFAVLLLPVLGLVAGWVGTFYFVCWFLDPEYPYESSVVPYYAVEALAVSVFGFFIGLVAGIAMLLWSFSPDGEDAA